MPLKELLDPQGKAVANNMKNLDLAEISSVRIGKHISVIVDAADEVSAKERIDTACKKLLSNPVIEYYEYTLEEMN